MKDMSINRPLHWFAVLTAVATFLLLGVGGLVTSHEAGMSVPDWPTSYGYNMFALTIRFWKGGAFSNTRTGCSLQRWVSSPPCWPSGSG